MNSNEKIFRLKPKKVWKHFLGFIIYFSGLIMFSWGMLSSESPLLVEIILFIFTLFCLFYSCYILIFLITTKLKISDFGVSYSQPLYSVSFEWKYTRVCYLNDILYFVVDDEFAQTHFSIIEKILINQQNIWLNFFIDGYDKFDYWQKDPVLVELQKHLPYLTDAARENF